MPFVDGRYPTRPDREWRAVMGASLGGIVSVYLALTRPALFGRFAGQSSAFFLEEEAILTLARTVEQSFVAYFDVGRYEPQFIPAHYRLAEALRDKGSRCFIQARHLPSRKDGPRIWDRWSRLAKPLSRERPGEVVGCRAAPP